MLPISRLPYFIWTMIVKIICFGGAYLLLVDKLPLPHGEQVGLGLMVAGAIALMTLIVKRCKGIYGNAFVSILHFIIFFAPAVGEVLKVGHTGQVVLATLAAVNLLYLLFTPSKKA